VSELIGGIPSTLTLESFSFNGNRVSFQISASSLEAVTNYETALKNNSDYYDVKFSINKDSTEINVVISFGLTSSSEKK
jgi:Tfp pilus assembly protein PilN